MQPSRQYATLRLLSKARMLNFGSRNFSKSTGPNRFKFAGNLSLMELFRISFSSFKSDKSFKSHMRVTHTHSPYVMSPINAGIVGKLLRI
ncbi:Protein of unknown function [Cotesia congregata]|uniref:Uncharacterized protein n=1 Tax=Cotesia congregata TaxID=51543 RepID=A0A8J2HK74_COTCN|nr:Protein of unknown function [Cotesia congregata]